MPRFPVDDGTVTVNSADDPDAGPGGFYISQSSGGEKSTWTYDENYNLIKQDGKKVQVSAS